MRLVKCADCGAEISPRAKACPSCGAPPRRSGLVRAGIVAGLLGIAAIYVANRVPSVGVPVSDRPAATSHSTEASLTPEVVISGDPTLLPRSDVEQAISEFRRICQPLGGAMWSDLQSANAEVFSEYVDYRLAKGWKTTILLKLTVPDRPIKIPELSTLTGVIAGHVLYYYIGGGREPGFFARKRASQYLCGMRVTQVGADEFMRASEFGFLR